jgi:hypothetical protein
MPATRVIKHLGHLSALELENLKTALAASRRGRRVFVGKAPVGRPPKATANLGYLDIAVLLETWRQWQLDELVDDLLGGAGDAVVTPAAIVSALTLQRCVAPGSKLAAERWFPTTALPELLDVAPQHFNNTRVHRVLDALDQCGVDLMAKLPRRYTEREGAFAAMFLDVTDTWFVGHGPKMADRAKTKEGFVRRKVGIVLLCNERGYPLRWEVLRGAESDKSSMARTVASIAGRSWLGDAPIVCDRSMGNTAQIRQLLKTKVRFVTALVKSEFGAYSEAIAHQPFADFVVTPWANKRDRDEQAAIAARLAEGAGMVKVDDRLYVHDLNVIEHRTDDQASYADESEADTDPVVRAVGLSRKMREAVADGRAESLAAVGRTFGLTKGLTHKYRRLSDLSEDIQLAVLDGKAKGASLGEMLRIVEQSSDAQHEAFEQLLGRIVARGGKRPRPNEPPKTTSTNELPVRVRGVIYFNPEMFVDQRLIAQRRLADIESFTRQLNERLQSPRSKLTKAKVLAQVEQKLKTWDLVEAYDVGVDKLNDKFRVHVTLKVDEWARRRRYDGFSFLVAHPDIPHSAAELCRLYRGKDTIEKDFETIKSCIELRPVRHRLDAKVRAHVTICMLALLLERSLNDKLGKHFTAKDALEELSRCHLNQYPTKGSVAAYDVTTIDETQRNILHKLRLQRLADDDEVVELITPR